MAGFNNGTVFADNVDFTGSATPTPKVTADGELLIGSTAAPNIRVGSLASSGGTVTITAGAGTINLEAGAAVPTQFDGDSGSATPAANILNVNGGTGITTSAAGNTVTIETTGATASQFDTDSGSAFPAAGVLQVLGGSGVDTSGAGNTVTVTAGTDVATTYAADSGSATPAANSLNVFGGTLLTSSGAGSTLTINADGAVAASVATDAGTATPNANAFTIAGGTGISTAGAAATVTVSASADVATTYAADTGSATPAANSLTVTGGTGIATSGAGAILTIDASADVATTYNADSGSATPALNALSIVGAGSVSTSGSGSTITITGAAAGGQPITDYVVDPTGGGSYTTIQSAVNAANAAGGGSVWIRPGSYSESLTLYDNISLVGADAAAGPGQGVIITGTATLPATGDVFIRNIAFQTASAVTAASSSSCNLIMQHCAMISGGSASMFSTTSYTGDATFINCTTITTAALVNCSDDSAGTLTMVNCSYPFNFSSPPTATRWDGDTAYFIDCSGLPLSLLRATTATIAAWNCAFYGVTLTTGTAYFYSSSFRGIGSASGLLMNGGTAYLYHCSAYTTGTLSTYDFTASTADITAHLYHCNATATGSGQALTAANSTNTCTVNLNNCVLDVQGSSTYVYGSSAGTVNSSGTSVPGVTRLTNASTPTINYVAAEAGGGVAWQEITGTSANMTSNSGYIANNAALVTLTLPVNANPGDTLKVMGKGAGLWRVAQNSGQKIHYAASTTTTGATGRIDPTNQYDSVELVCSVRNTDWTVISFTGTITVT